MITERQLEVLTWIYEFIQAHEYSPTYQEICEGTGVRSRARVHHMLGQLKDREYIDWLPNRRRCIQILRMPGVPLLADDLLARIAALEARVAALEGHSDKKVIPLRGSVR